MPRAPLVRPWTDAEVSELRRMWSEGVSAFKIALRLRRGVSAVKGKAHLVGLPARHHSTRAKMDGARTDPKEPGLTPEQGVAPGNRTSSG